MRAIIDGFRYDTDKAELVGEYDNLHKGVDSFTDFGYWEAGLYRTPKTGRYFLAGEGGAMTRFARPAGNNSMGGGSRIIPMREDEAFDWAQSYLDAGDVEKHFGHLLQDA